MKDGKNKSVKKLNGKNLTMKITTALPYGNGMQRYQFFCNIEKKRLKNVLRYNNIIMIKACKENETDTKEVRFSSQDLIKGCQWDFLINVIEGK